MVIAWGSDGHKTVASIASSLIEENTVDMVQSLLAGSGSTSLDDIATWADEVGHTPAYAWSKCMHFVDTEGENCYLSNESKNCKCCVVSGIANYTERLADFTLSSADRFEALKFLVHFVGDATQPLHAGHKADMGGNLIHVMPMWVGRHETTNLHTVWDSSIIEHLLHLKKWSHEDLAKQLVEKIKDGAYPLPDWEKDCGELGSPKTCPEDMSGESAELACEYAYTDEKGIAVVTGSQLSLEYYETRISVIETRLASAGVRLASILNSICQSKSEARTRALFPEFPSVYVT
jgi:hypothetical protein